MQESRLDNFICSFTCSGDFANLIKESWSSVDSPGPAAMPMPSPRVTVSVWDKEGEQPIRAVGRSFTSESDGTDNGPLFHEDALSVETLHGSLPSVSRDTRGCWLPDSATGQRGLAPENRPSEETPSINQIATARKTDEKNQHVASWVSETVKTACPSSDASLSGLADRPSTEDDNIPNKEIPLGHETVNRHAPDQVYYNIDFTDDQNGERPAAGFTQTNLVDLDLLPTRNWANAPMVHPISRINSRRNQPETSQAAMEKFERMCQDNASVVSYAATWGTRRRSLPSLIDTEGVISGNFFKRLAIRGDSSSRRPSILKEISTLVRRPSQSQLLKRKGSNSEEQICEESTSNNRRESRDSLAPPSRAGSWGLRQRQMPSLNTAIVGMATGAASIGASQVHARTGSISATSIASPKSPFNLVPGKTSLRRPRSKTELSKSESPYPNIVGMLKKAGGPPVAQLAKSQAILDQEDDEDDEDDAYDEPDMKVEAGKVEHIIPNFEGFQQHILGLNPALAATNQYLIDRIGHQMVIRYKNLQNMKIKHLKAAHSGHCASGSFCMENGGTALHLDTRGDTRGADPLSCRPDSSDGETNPLEGGINAETFPAGIPMPPTTILPAVSVYLVLSHHLF
jgi:hypothetical protein